MHICYSLQDWHQKMNVCEHLQNVVGLQEDLLSLRHKLKEIRSNIITMQKKKEEYKSLSRCVKFLVYKERKHGCLKSSNNSNFVYIVLGGGLKFTFGISTV